MVHDVSKMNPMGHLLWILVIDDQHDYLYKYCLLVILDIVQMMQSRPRLRPHGSDPGDQHVSWLCAYFTNKVGAPYLFNCCSCIIVH